MLSALLPAAAICWRGRAGYARKEERENQVTARRGGAQKEILPTLAVTLYAPSRTQDKPAQEMGTEERSGRED